jgi:hypothetical protein
MKFSRGHAIEDDLEIIIFNAAAATIKKWQPLKLLRCKTCTTQHRTMKFYILIDVQRMSNFSKTFL